MVDPNNPYTQMQRKFYNKRAQDWSFVNRDPVVYNFDWHNMWRDYELLFKWLKTKNKVALDFGCGPGRAMVLYKERFKKIDGVDISNILIDKAAEWLNHHGITGYELYVTDGVSLKGIPSNKYDIVYSTITLQHICVHSIRYNIMKEIYRVLKPNGWFTAQMGFGERDGGREYEDDYYEAEATNGYCDTRVKSPKQLRGDLYSLGFKDFRYWITKTGPNDQHQNWIFFRARKPIEINT